MTKLLIVNRGEIAHRILRTARARGYTVGVVSTSEEESALIRKEADKVFEIPHYLDQQAILQVARTWRANLIHPGYGFLSENAEFAANVEKAKICFVGPTAASMRLLGDKLSSKRLARSLLVPCLPSVHATEVARLKGAELSRFLSKSGLIPPLLIKASAGGGGRGMRKVLALSELSAALAQAAEEAYASFGSRELYVERFLEHARHIEIQIVGDGKGGGIALGERECSLQRRHQKIIEESPSPFMTEALRTKMVNASLSLVGAAKYRGVGTVEFLVDKDRRFYFLEVNTRIQVEHPVTECTFGGDLVDVQFDIAEGRWPSSLPSPNSRTILQPQGSAIEVRILAEDPSQGYLPTPGPLLLYRMPQGPHLRIESGVTEGDVISPKYDSLIAKVIVKGSSRKEAVSLLQLALNECRIHGTTTNIPFLRVISHHPDFIRGKFSTDWLTSHQKLLITSLNRVNHSSIAKMLSSPLIRTRLWQQFLEKRPSIDSDATKRYTQLNMPLSLSVTEEDLALRWHSLEYPHGYGELISRTQTYPFICTRVSPSLLEITLAGEHHTVPLKSVTSLNSDSAMHRTIFAPMTGVIRQIPFREGDTISSGDIVFIIESMKMLLEIRAQISGVLTLHTLEVGTSVQTQQRLAEITPL